MEGITIDGLSEEGYAKRSKTLSKIRAKALEIDKQIQLSLSVPTYLLSRARTSINSFQNKLDNIDEDIERDIKKKYKTLDDDFAELTAKYELAKEKYEKAKRSVRNEVEEQYEIKKQSFEKHLEENLKKEEVELLKSNRALNGLKIDFQNMVAEYERYYGKCPIQLNLHQQSPLTQSQSVVQIIKPPQPVVPPSKTFIEVKEKLPTIHFQGVDLPFLPHEVKEEKSLEQLREEAKRIDREQQEKEEEYKIQLKEQRERERRAREEADRIRQDAQRKKEIEEREEEEDDNSSVSSKSSTASWIKQAMKEDLEWGLDEQKALELSRQKRSSFTSSLGTSSSSFYTTGTNTNVILGGVPSAPALPPPKPKKPVKTVPKREPAKNIGEVATYKQPEDD